METSPMKLAWTTVGSLPDAEALATQVVAARLAACVQIEGPIRSVYWWQGQIERSEEFRLTFKCLAETLPALETLVLSQHAYDTPEWIVINADAVAEKYLSWVRATSSPSPL